MDEEGARVLAVRVLDEFEQLLAARGIMILLEDRDCVPGEACLHGGERSRLQEAIVSLLLEPVNVAMTDRDAGDASHPVRQLAIAILDEFEELLADKSVMIPSDDREGREEEACLYGEEYYELEDGVTDLLIEEVGGFPVVDHGCAANRNTSGCATRK